MGRVIKQPLPQPPAAYDQTYVAQLADAINDYMYQAQAPAEAVAARFILIDPVHIPGDLSNTAGLPTGMIYLAPVAGNAAAAAPGVSFQAWSTGSITLTTTAQNIPGCSVTLQRAGSYLIIATFDFVAANEQGAYLYGKSTVSPHLAVCDTGSNTGRFTVSQQAIATGAANQVIQLQAYKSGGSGNSSTSTECSLTALWIPGISSAAAGGQGFLTVVGTGDP
jgi:hypothetical protein